MSKQLLQLFSKQYREIVQEIVSLQHKKQIYKENTQIEEQQYRTLQSQNTKLQHYLMELENQLKERRLIYKKAQPSLSRQQKQRKNQQHQRAICRYKQKLIDQKQVMDQNVVIIPNNSLQKMEQFFEQKSYQSIVEIVQSNKQAKLVLKKLQQNRDKLDKILQHKTKHIKQTRTTNNNHQR